MRLEEFSWYPYNTTAVEAATILNEELFGPDIPVDENLLLNLEDTCLNYRNFVLRRGLTILATGGLSIQYIESGIFSLENIGVKKEYQRLGVGKNLIGKLEEIARDSTDTATVMYVQPNDSTQAVDFYLSLGYRPKNSNSDPYRSSLFKIIE